MRDYFFITLHVSRFTLHVSRFPNSRGRVIDVRCFKLNCEEVKQQLTAYLNDELDVAEAQQISQHLSKCEKCRALLDEQQRLDTILSMRQKFEPPYSMYANLQEKLQKYHSKRFGVLWLMKRLAIQFAVLFIIVTATLIIDRSFLTKRMITTKPDVAINLYLIKHREATIHLASLESTPESPSFSVHQDDILYYEKLRKDTDMVESESGLILKGKDSNQTFSFPKRKSLIKKKRIGKFSLYDIKHPKQRFLEKSTSLDKIHNSLNFEPVAPLKLYPGYILMEIKKIQEKQCVQLIYTDGIHTLSIFQQAAGRMDGLFPQDFREYALYQSAKGNDATILAWKDTRLMYVMVGNRDMSLLMDLAKSI
jgi:hypothetical protein